jgi:hypothetical protein
MGIVGNARALLCARNPVGNLRAHKSLGYFLRMDLKPSAIDFAWCNRLESWISLVYGKICAVYGIFCIISGVRTNGRVAIFAEQIL